MGELCIHEDQLYECITAIAAPGEAWNANHWKSVVLADGYKDLKSDIESKQTAPSVAGTAGQVLGLDAQLHPVWVDQTGGGGGDAPVQDVQINGTSVVNNGVANVPIATTNKLGAVMVGTGLSISNGWLSPVGAMHKSSREAFAPNS